MRLHLKIWRQACGEKNGRFRHVAHSTDRAIPGDIGYHERRTGRIDGQHIQVMNTIRRQGGNDHLDLIAHAFREQRPQRTVNQASG